MGPSAKDRILEAIDDLAPYLIEASKSIHRIAEPGFREFESSSYCAGEMQKHGFRVEKPVASLETAFRADFSEGLPGKTIAFCCEYDAIPGLGHGCGHNLIAASAMGAAIALRKGIGPLPGRVVVMGTPAEEGGAGKAVMIDQGVWDDVDICMEIHAHPIDHFTVSKTSNALQGFDIEFRGRGPKKGKPHYDEVNALDAANLFMMGINMIREHLGVEARIQYRWKEEGGTCDTIPQKAVTEVWVRGGTAGYLNELIDKVKTCAHGVASAVGAEVQFINFTPRFEPILPNLTLEGVVGNNVEYLGLKFKPTDVMNDIIRYYAERSYHGPHQTDFGNVSQKMPSAHIKVGLEHEFSFHTPEAVKIAVSDKAHQVMIQGTKIMALTGFDLLNNPELVENCWKEFHECKAGLREVPSWHLERW
jgi:amidohydrolase